MQLDTANRSVSDTNTRVGTGRDYPV